jgi:hypothetical protein
MGHLTVRNAVSAASASSQLRTAWHASGPHKAVSEMLDLAHAMIVGQGVDGLARHMKWSTDINRDAFITYGGKAFTKVFGGRYRVTITNLQDLTWHASLVDRVLRCEIRITHQYRAYPGIRKPYLKTEVWVPDSAALNDRNSKNALDKLHEYVRRRIQVDRRFPNPTAKSGRRNRLGDFVIGDDLANW